MPIVEQMPRDCHTLDYPFVSFILFSCNISFIFNRGLKSLIFNWNVCKSMREYCQHNISHIFFALHILSHRICILLPLTFVQVGFFILLCADFFRHFVFFVHNFTSSIVYGNTFHSIFFQFLQYGMKQELNSDHTTILH